MVTLPDLTHGEGRPATNGTALENPTNPAPSLSDLVEVRHDDDAAEVFFRTSYAVLVRGKSVRRHLYFNLPAAERAVRRARGRGDRADLLLVELVPVVGGGDQ